jgi:hypothetical protein
MSLIVDARAACPPALARRDALLDHFASCLDSMMYFAPAVQASPPATPVSPS